MNDRTREILVLLDGSTLAEAALQPANWLAGPLGAQLVLLMVVDPGERANDAEGGEAAAGTPQDYLQRVAERLTSSGAQVSIDVRRGKAATIVADLASRSGVVLTVLTTYGGSGDSHHLGGTAERLSRTLPGASLFVPPHADPPLAVESVVVALDGSETAEAALTSARELAQTLKLPLTLVRVAPWANELFAAFVGIAPIGADEEIELGSNTYLAPIAESLSEHLTADYLTLRGHAADVLVEYAQSQNALIVLASHGHSGVRSWGLGSTTDKVLRASPRPVLIARVGDDGPVSLLPEP